ncbi:acyl-CoA synthetase [Cryptosporangium sp. NPDC048952]|uniref:acyl-CoA synthetase n=1 Tax=Cryptosporangium sp. NPDC048952 TaxID=3363961 RepID=UPI003721AB7F
MLVHLGSRHCVEVSPLFRETPVVSFNLAQVFQTVADSIPDTEAVVLRNRRLTYREMNEHADGIAHYLADRGLGVRKNRAELAGHESGQDHIGLYLRNCPEYIEAMVAGHRARLAPFNVNYRYVAEELSYLLTDARARALVYHAEFAPRVQEIRDRLPDLEVLIQVDDDSGNALLEGAVAFESILDTTGDLAPASGDDLLILYTGGTTGMPKGVLWRQDDIYVAAMGGTPFGSPDPYPSYEAIAAAAAANPGGQRVLMIPPFIHGAAQWSAFYTFTNGGTVILLDDTQHLSGPEALRLLVSEGVVSVPVLGDAVVLPVVEEIERAIDAGEPYDLSALAVISNGGAPLSPGMRDRLLAVLPNLMLLDAGGASETGIQMSALSATGAMVEAGVFDAHEQTAVIDDTLTRSLKPGEGEGWLARRGRIPLGYHGDAEKTARTFPVVDGVRWSLPGDRAELLADGRVRLLGRDSATINTGGEKVFAEEVERSLLAHPAVRDVIVAGRPSSRWGSEVVAIVELNDPVSDEELIAESARHIARYKLPKAVIRVPEIARSPSGKADYRWAKEQVKQRG